jgi:hypothetical protein
MMGTWGTRKRISPPFQPLLAGAAITNARDTRRERLAPPHAMVHAELCAAILSR